MRDHIHFLTGLTRWSWSWWLGSSGLVVVTGVAIGLAGLPGLVVGVLLAVCWLRLPPEYTFALGQFALGAAAPTAGLTIGRSPAPLAMVALGELGLMSLLLAAPNASRHPQDTVAGVGVTTMLVSGGLGLGWWSATRGVALWLVSGGLVVAGGGLVYLIQMYDRWRFRQPPDRTGGDQDYDYE